MVNERVVVIWLGLFNAGGIAALLGFEMKVSNSSSFSKV